MSGAGFTAEESSPYYPEYRIYPTDKYNRLCDGRFELWTKYSRRFMLCETSFKKGEFVRNATLLLLVGIAVAATLLSFEVNAEKAHPPKDCHVYSYAQTLKVGAPKANPRDQIRQRVYETDHSCNPKQDMTWFQDSRGKPILRRKDTYWLPKQK